MNWSPIRSSTPFLGNAPGKSSSNSRKSDGRIAFSVADNGIGLPPDEALAKSSSLGLQLVQLFIEQLHGELQTDRQDGCRFTVSFPKNLAGKDAP